jgi:hypothetical protein
MSWTRRNIRIVSALLVALLAYAAIPHFHIDRTDPGRLASAILLADDAHDSHSSDIEVDSAPCALCRNASPRTLAATPTEPFQLEAGETSPRESLSVTRRPELLLAERHPARAPPRA